MTAKRQLLADRHEYGQRWRFVQRPRKLHLESAMRPRQPAMRYTLCGLYVLGFYVRRAPVPVERFCRKCRERSLGYG